jgi:molecular chaperone IbpA
MRSYDLSPLFRTSVGFDRMARMMDALAQDATPSYPPYNIEKLGEDAYRITMAVAGFGEDDLSIEVKENQLRVTGRLDKDEDQPERQFLHRGIAERAFERRFTLAEHIKVRDAMLENGLLHVDLIREVPEEAKPRHIPIVGAGAKRLPQG